MTIRATIDKAGSFPVKWNPAPYHTPSARLDVPRTGVLHTTEGGWDGSEGVFKRHFSPHFMLGYHPATKKVEIEQLLPIGSMGMATKAHDNLAIVQIEMIGFSKEQPWLPDPQTLDALCSLMNVCKDEWGIPLSHPWPDGDYGRAGPNAHRSSGKLGKVAGWFGHGDMPSPDSHWDPGNLQWSKVFARCAELSKPTPKVA
jgi:hypothetical protein